MILKNSAILAFFSIISLLLGIVRDRVLATIVGVGPMLDVYNASFRIPDLVYGILLAAVSASTVVPFIAKAAKENEEELRERFNSLFFFFGFSLVAISVIAIILLPFLTSLIVPGFDVYQKHYFVIASSIMMIQPLFLGLSALVSALAQVNHRFILYSAAPLAYTLTIIFSIPLLYPRLGVVGLAIGVIVGAIINFILQSYTLYEERMHLRMSMFRWKHVVNHMRVAVPRSLSTVVSRLREIIFVSVATSLGVGVLSVYLFAQRIMDAFVQVVVQSAATATLPLLAHKHAIGEHKDYARILKVNVMTIFAVSCLAAIFIALFRDIIVRVLYGNVNQSGAIAKMAMFLAVDLPFYALITYFVSAFSAAKETLTLFYINLLASVASIAVLFVASKAGYGTFSIIVAAWTLGISYVLLLLFVYSRKKGLS